MGEPSIWWKIKNFIGGVGWSLFLWSINMTQDEYLQDVYENMKEQYDDMAIPE